MGLTGPTGLRGDRGPTGAVGSTGPIGATGAAGSSTIITSAQYVQLGSQPATVAAGQPFTFTTAVLLTPSISAATGIFAPFTASGTVFTIGGTGRYEINYQTNYPTPSGVVLYLNGLPLPYTMIGKAVTDTGGQVSGSVIVEIAVPNSTLSVNAAAGNSSAIGVPPNSSTTNQSATTVSFKRIS
jgi:hypothetical protein